MFKTINRWRNRSKLADARIARQLAHVAYMDALSRRDSRTVHHAEIAFAKATRRVLELER